MKKMAGKTNYSLRNVLVFPDSLEISVSGKTLKLEPKIMALLGYFAERPNQVLAKEQILSDVWPGTKVVDEALQRAVSILRKKLGDNQENPVFLETISKRGYRFLVAAAPVPPEEEEDMNLTERKIKVSPLILIITGLAGALVAFLVWQGFSRDQPFVPKPDGRQELQSDEPAPLAPEPDGQGDGN